MMDQPLLPFAPASWLNDNPWTTDEEETIWLLTPIELEVTPPGTVVTSILGDRKIVGEQKIDSGTRFGYTAYGLTEAQFKH
jgi:hypothetical protein